MQLKDFVRQTLVDVVAGVAEAQSDEVYGGNISPASSGQGNFPDFAFVSTQGLIAMPMKFDVALTISESDGAEGGGKIQVLGFSAGGGVNNKNERQSVNRVQFEVPVSMPTTRKKPHKIGKESE